MPTPFRFGVQLDATRTDDLVGRVQTIERLGFSAVLVEDHFGTQLDPLTAMAVAAASTERLIVGSLTLGVDFRTPAVHAKAAATLAALFPGRCELGLGAGWLEEDYHRVGLAFERAGTRIERLREAIEIVDSLWAEPTTDYRGRHFRVVDHPQTVVVDAADRPRVLVGGGGPKVLALAGELADIVSINPSLPAGRVTDDVVDDMSPDRVAAKVGWAAAGAEAAGRDPSALEFSILIHAVGLDDQADEVEELVTGFTPLDRDAVRASALFLTGGAAEVCAKLVDQREATGISYVVVKEGDHLAAFADGVVRPLAGQAPSGQQLSSSGSPPSEAR